MQEQFSKTEAVVSMICMSLAIFCLDSENGSPLATLTFSVIGITLAISVLLQISINSKNNKNQPK